MNRQVITTKQRVITLLQGNQEVDTWLDKKENCCDIILDQINNERLYDPVLANKDDLLILDLGANVGLFSMYAYDSAKQIIAVEPTPGCINVFKQLTAGMDKIKLVQAALGDSNNDVPFFVHENNTINSIAVDQNGDTITVQGTTLENLLKTQNLDWVDFVKCDIEGSELVALTDQTLSPVRDKIGSWFIEVHQSDVKQATWPGNLEQNRQKLISILKNAGYSAEPVIHDQIFAWS